MAKRKIISEKVKTFLLGSALIAGMKADSTAFSTPERDEKTDKKELVGKQTQQETNYDAIELNSIEDMYKLFDMSLNIIFAELVLEEVPMQNAYDDYGLYKGTKNTFGTGSTYSPLDIKDYNNPDAKWYHLASNPKSFGDRVLSYQEMLELVIGWAKYRTKTQKPKTGEFVTRNTVLERMFEKLKGASLRPNEFAALFCAVYNNENSNIPNLCPYIRDNCQDPILCANKLMTWWKNAAHNNGTLDRCEFESLVYLNADGFCECIMDLYTKPLTKTGVSCINVNSVKQEKLTKDNYKKYSNDALTRYKSVVYTGGVCTRDVCVNSGWDFMNPLPLTVISENKLQTNYNDAMKVYAKSDYKKALELFLELEKQGANGADLWNDIAITYYNLKQYDNCIKYCKKVLETTEHEEYAKACYNAGLAYEAQGNYDRAIINYEAALNHYKQYGISDQDSKVDYERIYKKAKDRAVDAKKKTSQVAQNKSAKIKAGQKRVTTKNFAADAKNQLAMKQRKVMQRTTRA